MRALGAFFRYVLSINTIWGGMIVISFAACVIQHYWPTTTVIPAGLLKPGDNALTVRIKDPAGKWQESTFQVVMESTGLSLPTARPSAQPGERGRPWLISARPAGDAWLLKWDAATYGEYDVAINGRAAGRGKLVTLGALTDKAFEYATTAFEVAMKLVATMVLFLGLMKVGEDAGIVQLAARLFHPVIRLLFPDVPKDHPASGAILMNITTSILGVGNAATPLGLKAMKELEDLNPHKGIASDAQVMLLAYNTTGLALIPTMLLAVRKSAGCTDPFEIIGPCLLAGAVSTTVALVLAKVLGRLPFFSVRAALAEEVREQTARASAGQEEPA